MKIRQKAKTLRNRALATTLAIVLLLMISPQAPPAYAAELPGDAPVGVDGRILTPDKTGDICNWVEIAQYGEYSLIVRSEFLNLQSYHYGEPIWQTARWQIPRDGNSNVGYTRDNVSHCINCWFNFFEVKVSDDGLNTFYDVLPEHARLREFTMQHNALGTLGTRYTSTTLTDGLSRPTNYQVGVGDNIAFCLSYSEAANFLSLTRNFPGANEITYLSPPEAVANFHKVNIPTTPEVYYFGMWLRTPGNNAMTESALLDYGYVHELDVLNTPTNTGQAFGYGLIYPALWVHSDIFDEKGTVNIQHLDATTGETLSPSESHEVKAGHYGPYPPKDIRFYQTGVLAPGSDPAEGTIRDKEVKNITYLYTRGNASVIVIHLDLANNNMIGMDTLTIPAGDYGPYGPKDFDGYAEGELLPISDPISGEADVGQTVTIYYGYQRATITVNIIHKTPTSILWTETFTLPVGDYGPYYPFVFPGYKPGVWDTSSDEPSGTIEEIGTVVNVVFIYEPL